MKAALDQAFARVLQLQSVLQGVISPLLYSTNATSAATQQTTTPPPISMEHQGEIARVLDYWFPPPSIDRNPTEKWFRPPEPEVVDAEIRAEFSSLIEQARNDSLAAWASTPLGSLALIVLLDQFPRNMYRGSALAFASDAKALDLAVASVAREFDRSPDLTPLMAMFFYMPLMHAESLVDQVAGIALFETLAARCLDGGSFSFSSSSDASASPRAAVELDEAAKFVQSSRDFAKAHRDVILRFGRFPSRNAALGRQSTPEEVEFLSQNPGGFVASGGQSKSK